MTESDQLRAARLHAYADWCRPRGGRARWRCNCPACREARRLGYRMTGWGNLFQSAPPPPAPTPTLFEI